ncbi:hypothetical protein KSP40_PGU002236 [Platanthera guangdongensis]|uniref:Uncharacterized protein n=1 Tax=Platanthera guangdongensis TaxID=2320717 RepID=A0ABR2M932_9ASPA
MDFLDVCIYAEIRTRIQIPFPGTIILSTRGMFLSLLPSGLQCSRMLLMTLNGPARLYRYAYNPILP